MNKETLVKALRAIAEGYPIKVYDDQFICVGNPEFDEPWKEPALVIDVKEIEEWMKE